MVKKMISSQDIYDKVINEVPILQVFHPYCEIKIGINVLDAMMLDMEAHRLTGVIVCDKYPKKITHYMGIS